jgi:hypothetical protein
MSKRPLWFLLCKFGLEMVAGLAQICRNFVKAAPLSGQAGSKIVTFFHALVSA